MTQNPQPATTTTLTASAAAPHDFVLEPPAPALPVPIESASGKVRKDALRWQLRTSPESSGRGARG